MRSYCTFNARKKPRSLGFSMIEVLVSLVILMVGLMGLMGLVIRSQQNETESYQRVQAVLLLTDMVNRMTANNGAAPCYVTATSVYFGSGSSYVPTCSYGSIAQQASAITDMAAWDANLKGSSETLAGASVGGVVGARGCVVYDSVAGAYYVTVAWQGLGLTFAPPVANKCGAYLYGDEKLRRVVNATVKFGALY